MSGLHLIPSQLPNEPVILTDLMTNWGAMTPSHRWTLPDLAARFTTETFRAEATLTTLPRLLAYDEHSQLDESPLYLFDSDFVEKTQKHPRGGLGEDYEVPECFREDFFAVMKDERPDYRWLIVGPTRSGSTWHQDPNRTAAWNAVTVGSKAWVAFPPDVTPPGVFVSADQAEVEAPLSLAEWFVTYYKGAKAMYGPRAKDASNRGKMREGICNEGEIFYVPSGWWHIVINLAPSIAVTQNLVSHRELPDVLRFMRDRPEQVSGFKLRKEGRGDDVDEGGLGECDECVSGVYEAFVEALKRECPEELEAVEELKEVVAEKTKEVKSLGTVWSKVKEQREEEGEGQGGGFSFGFGGGDDLVDEGEVE